MVLVPYASLVNSEMRSPASITLIQSHTTLVVAGAPTLTASIARRFGPSGAFEWMLVELKSRRA